MARIDTDAPFLELHPPHWAARGLWYALLATALVGLTAAFVVKVPATITGRFTLTAPRGTNGGPITGEMLVPESAYARVDSGQPVRLRFDAFPYQRYGVRSATVRSIGLESGSAGGTLRIAFELDDRPVAAGSTTRPLLAGMSGRADIVTGRRTLGGFLFGSYIED